MAKKKTAAQRNPIGWAVLVWLVLCAGLLFLTYWGAGKVPALGRFVHAWPQLSVIPGIVIATVVGIWVGIATLDRPAQKAKDDPTPAELWARAHGWEYSFEATHFDENVKAAVGAFNTGPFVYDLCIGTWGRRPVWAFCYDGYMPGGSVSEEAVVMRLSNPWPGELAVAAKRNLVGWSGGDPVAVGGCYVNGTVEDSGVAQIVQLLRPTGILEQFARAGLSKGTVLGVWTDAGDYVALQTTWADDPDHVLPVALELLTRLTTILEADTTNQSAHDGESSEL